MRSWLAVACLVCGLAAGCGRLRYEERECVQGTAEVGGDAGTPFCIDVAQHSEWLTYVATDQFCNQRGMRMCTDAEWYQACLAGVSTDMTDDWEWVSDLITETDAAKRGAGGCDATSSHNIDSDFYGVRCCDDI